MSTPLNTPAAGALLSASGLRHAYGQRQVLDGVDLEVRRGEIVALLGANGAGKSTLLSILTGLRAPDAGQVRVLGRDPRERGARSAFGAMLQDGELPPSLRVGELIEFFRSLYPQPMALDEAVALADLQDLLGHAVGALSGGQKQRLKFALAVAGDPPLLFLDEPTVAMDSASRRLLRDALRARVAGGRAIVLTTHDLGDVEALADRVVVLHGGRVRSAGSPAQIKAAMGGRSIQFRSDRCQDGQVSTLPGVQQARREGGQWWVRTTQAEDSVRRLLQTVPDLSDLSVQGLGLEESLQALTETADQGVPA